MSNPKDSNLRGEKPESCLKKTAIMAAAVVAVILMLLLAGCDSASTPAPSSNAKPEASK